MKLTYSDPDYKLAINYKQSLYNYPITLNIDNDKYILPFGTSDIISEFQENNLLYLIGENSGLDYISCMVIDIVEKKVLDDVFLDNCSNNELTENIFDLDTEEQLRILDNYMY